MPHHRNRARLQRAPSGPLSQPEVRSALHTMRKLRARCRRACEHGDQHRIERARWRLFASYEARLAALILANRWVKEQHRLPPHTLKAEAKRLDVRAGTTETVRQHAVAKDGGGYRFISVFGVRNKALQALLKWAIEPLVRQRIASSQFMLRGGRDAATDRVQKMLRCGAAWACELDIKNFYPTINVREVFRRLGLSEGLGLAIMDMAALRIRASEPIAARIVTWAGLPQGALLSPLLGEFVVSEMLREAQHGPSATFADNILIVGADRFSVEWVATSLCASFEASPLGNFTMKSGTVRRACDGFKFLGYWHRRRAGVVVSRPSDANVQKFIRRMWERREEGSLRSTVRAWTGCFRAWTSADRFCDYILTPVRRGRRIGMREARMLMAVVNEPRFTSRAWPPR